MQSFINIRIYLLQRYDFYLSDFVHNHVVEQTPAEGEGRGAAGGQGVEGGQGAAAEGGDKGGQHADAGWSAWANWQEG